MSQITRRRFQQALLGSAALAGLLLDLRGYHAHMAALDDCFNRLLETVEASGSDEDTIVVFTSDHGDMMFSQGLEHKVYPWEESIRIPLSLFLNA
jgi:arylsulfatase A-like enzyme